jgi:hypothetical protein
VKVLRTELPLSQFQQKSIHWHATAFRRGMLGRRPSHRWCFGICAPLQALLLLDLNVESDLLTLNFKETDHVVLRLAGGIILDPTADQFPAAELPSVYLGPMPRIYQQWMDEYRHESRQAARQASRKDPPDRAF